MNRKLTCACLICDLDHALTEELLADASVRKYVDFASRSPILSGFPTTPSLLHHLHSVILREGQVESSDEIFAELLVAADDPYPDLKRNLLLLILMPALHKTSRQISVGFPSLGRDDIAQYLVTTVLEILQSKNLLKLKSHFAFAITRQMRRKMFRWALHEARYAAAGDLPTKPIPDFAEGSEAKLDSELSLGRFLDRCRSAGQLSEKEYELLMLFKIQGVPSELLASAEGLSEIAFRHRMQRIVDRLRRLAQSTSLTAHRKPISNTAASPSRPVVRTTSAA